jgi:membrane-bound lytic murein transglycosylase D
MKKNMNVSVYFALGGLVATTLIALLAFTEKKDLTNSFKKNSTQSAVVRSVPETPTIMSFAGEKVPLDRWDIKERFEREYLYNYYAPGPVLYVMKLANRYFPMIEETLKANGVPEDFKYLCIAESNLQNATSSAGAVGFWQFMKGTGSGYMEINDNVDERYNVQKSTSAACAYLKTAYQKFGSWTAAAASYNCGMGGYNGRANDQGTRHFYDLVLPEETSRYIFRILTFKQILENKGKNGFEIKDEELYTEVPHRTVTVSSSIPNLVQFAKQNGTTYYMLRQMNPWIRGKSLPVRGKSYTIKLPK